MNKLFLLLLIPILAFGQATTGYHRVNQLLARGTSGVTAQIVPNGSIYVTNTVTGATATIYSDPGLSSQITSGLVTSDKNGNYDYYIPLNYCVNETVSAPGQGSYTTENICINGGGGGSGTVGSGTAGQVPYYAANGTTVQPTSSLPNGITATTQTTGDNTAKVATDAFVLANVPVVNFASPPVLGSTTPNVVNGTNGNFSGTVAAGTTTPTTIGSTGVIFPDGTSQATAATNQFSSPPVLGSTTPNVVNGTNGNFSGTVAAGTTMQAPRITVTSAATKATDATPKSYVDHSTGVISLMENGGVCDGATDDTSAIAAANTAAEAAGATLLFPPNATCVQKSIVGMTGVVRWRGSNTTLALSPATPTQQMFGLNSITALEISGFTFSGNSNVVSVFAAGPGSSNFNFHDDVFTGITGCPVSPNTWLKAVVHFAATNHVRLNNVQFQNNGCAFDWQTSGPSGVAIYSDIYPSYDWDISDVTIDGNNLTYGMLLFDVFESTIHDNDIKNISLGGGANVNASGYGIAIYGSAICGGATLASPAGLSRTSNVVTINFAGTCSPALVTGDHIKITGSTSVGGTGFDGGYTIATGGTATATATPDDGISHANDTGGAVDAGDVGYLPRLNTVHDNRIRNTAGSGIYLQTNSDSTAANNVMVNVCQSMNDGTLPCGFIATTVLYRSAITGNTGSGSKKDGIVTSWATGSTITGNALGGTSHAIRQRGPELRNVIVGNTSNGASVGLEVDGSATELSVVGNTFAGNSYDSISQAAGANYNLYAGNIMDGGNVTSVGGMQFTGGNNTTLFGNVAVRMASIGYDLRSNYNLAAFNSFLASSGTGFTTTGGSGAYYNLLLHNLCQNDDGACIYNGATQSTNIFANNYAGTGLTPFVLGTGLAFGNTYKYGTSGNSTLATCTLSGGTCTISSNEVQSGDDGKIQCWRGATGANPGYPYVTAITAGTSFVVTSTNASDTGNVSCRISH